MVGGIWPLLSCGVGALLRPPHGWEGWPVDGKRLGGPIGCSSVPPLDGACTVGVWVWDLIGQALGSLGVVAVQTNPLLVLGDLGGL